MESESSPSTPFSSDSVTQCLGKFWYKLTRTKNIDTTTWSETKFAKCLSVFDLTFLGIGATLGSGIYLVTGQVAKSVAGPAVFLCFLIAGIASIFAGLCYAEFGARVPRAGSAYIYSYVTVGELCAFVIGWNLILEYIIGTASVARATSSYIDSLSGHAMSRYLTEHVPIQAATLSPYPDFLACGLVIIVSVVICFGISESALINNFFTIINLFTILYFIICGLFKLNFSNWNIPPEMVPDHTKYGNGGFLPYGFQGMMSGAATCFYAFVGFDIIATAGEETIDPEKSIPIAIICCLLVCSLVYIIPSIILTLMVPYFMLDYGAAVTKVFGQVGWYVAEYIISAGALSSLVTCLLTTSCGVPRVVYAMANDGLIFRLLAVVNKRFKTPAVATMTSALMTGFLALLFELKDLIDMMSIGTLMAYTVVSCCVLLLRYKCASSISPTTNSRSDRIKLTEERTTLFKRMGNILKPTSVLPTKQSYDVVKNCMLLMFVCSVWASLMLLHLWSQLSKAIWWAILLLCLPLVIILVIVVILWLQPQQDVKLTYKVPLVPLVPCLSICINVLLMLSLSNMTWIRFAIWMIIGFVIYFSYGIHHKDLDTSQSEEYIKLDGSFTDGDTISRNISLSEYAAVGQSGKEKAKHYGT